MAHQDVVSWDEFVQRVRRHRPSELIAAIAKTNIAVAPNGMWTADGGTPLFPWAMAVAARESLRAGNEYRPAGVTAKDLFEIGSRYHNVYDPVIDDGDALACLVRIAYEQFPFQEALFFGAARSRLLFERRSPDVDRKLRLIDSEFWSTTIGLPLEILFAAGMLFGVGALKNEGQFDLGWYGQDNFAAISKLIDESDARRAMAGLFGTDRATFKTMCPTPCRRGYERVAFNPLVARPFIHVHGDRFLAPVPQYVFWRASAPSLYYMALEKLAESDKALFTDDVGALFEDYVLRQAAQLPLEALYPQIEYAPGAYTTDAILVWPDFVLLIEAKATRLRQESRIGGRTLREDLNRTVGHAFEQIERTDRLIADGHTKLAHIPADRPRYGLVVTLEPYHFVDLARSELTYTVTRLPVAVVSILDFERFVADTLAEPIDGAQMAKLAVHKEAAWRVGELLSSRAAKAHRNPLLDGEYEALVELGRGV